MILINASSRESVGIFQQFYPIHPPVGLGYLWSYVRSQGIDVNIIDEQVEGDVFGEVERLVRDKEGPHFFGISVLTAAVASAVELANGLKAKYPDCFIAVGGHHPTAMPSEMLDVPAIDAVMKGEGEEPLVELYNCVKEGRDWTHVENLSYRANGEHCHNPITYSVRNLDSYPQFPYHLFMDNERYDMGFVFSSRGCPHQCIFCSCKSFPGGRQYRYREEQSVADEVELLHDKYGVDSVIFVDDNFLANMKRIHRLIAVLKERGLVGKMSYTFQARGDSFTREIAEELYAAGFNTVLFGLETSSEKVMRAIRKGETVAECVEAVKIAKEVGMTVGATFVFGLPEEDHRARMNCISMARELHIDVARFNNALPYPGTELYDVAKQQNRLRVEPMYSNFIAVAGMVDSPFRPVPLAYCPPGTTEDELRRDILMAFFRIYADVPALLRTLLSPAKSAKWMDLGKGWGFVKKLPAAMLLGANIVLKFLQLLYLLFIKKGSRMSLGKIKSSLRGKFEILD